MNNKVHITILGKEVLPAYYPIEMFSITEIYVIGTSQNYNDNVYRNLERFCKSQGRNIYFVQVEAYDIKSTITECENIHSKYSDDTEFLYNITGGTKIMALGAYRVATQHKASVIYTNSKDYIDLNTYESKPLTCSLSNKDIFKLQGQELNDYVIWDYTTETENVIASKEIQKFIRYHYYDYKHLSDNCIINDSTIINTYSNKSITYSFIDNHLLVTKNQEIILSVTSSNAKELLFRGRWWECLVANAIANWAKGRYEIWHSVVFMSANNPTDDIDTPVKNEIDILVNVGNTFVFVECKSGKLTQNEIYKMDYVKQTYGSDKSKSVLVSFRPLKEDLKIKASDSRIAIISPEFRGDNVLKNIPTKMNEIVNSLIL